MLSLQQIETDLIETRLVYCNLMQSTNPAKWLLLVEACNWAAKLSWQEAKDLKAVGKLSESKNHKARYERLMTAAKSTLIEQALSFGCKGFISHDKIGNLVMTLRHTEAGQIGLHGINFKDFNPETNPQIHSIDDNGYTSTGRQRFSEETVRSFLSEDKTFYLAVSRASVDKTFAAQIKNTLHNLIEEPSEHMTRIVQVYCNLYTNTFLVTHSSTNLSRQAL